MLFHTRRSVAPVIATLLMVAIAVVGGMLVFVFAQDFFTQTDSMTGPTIELLQVIGYDARDLDDDGGIRNHEGDVCDVNGVQGSTMQDGDVFTIFVRNLGANDIILSDVRVYGFSGDAAGASTYDGTTGPVPLPGEWTVNIEDLCEDGNAANIIGPGRDATIVIAYVEEGFGEPVKVGRPIFVTLETGAGNTFSKTVINGRALG